MKIPLYPVSRPLDMADKPLFDRIFAELQPRVSELTFAGLYLFRIAHDYRLTMIGDSVIVLGRGYDGVAYCLPPLGGNIKAALTVLFNDKHSLYGADQQFLEKYLSSGSAMVSEDRDSFDYLYLREELAQLPGNRFHKKKNRISYFTNRHHFKAQNYSDHFCSGCLKLLDNWMQTVRDKSNTSLSLELSATAEALQYAAELNLDGIVVTVDGAVAAFAIGEKLNHDTAVCHFEKSDPFKEGLSQLVNREFSRLLFTDCRYINREQDLGEAGLRNAKLSYHPTELIRKFRATPL